MGKNTKKKLLALLLVLVLALSLAPAAYAADGGTEATTYTVTLDNKLDGAVITPVVNGEEKAFDGEGKYTAASGDSIALKISETNSVTPSVTVSGVDGALGVTDNGDGTYTTGTINVGDYGITVTVSGAVTKTETKTETETVTDPVCTCTSKCTESAKDDDCPVCSAEGADLNACKGEADNGEEDKELAALQARIDALPTVDEYIAFETDEEQETAYNEVKALKTAIAELDGTSAAELDTKKLDALFNFIETGTYQTNDIAGGDYTLIDNGDGTYALQIHADAGTTSWRSDVTDKSKVTSVTIDSGVTTIGAGAFRYCKGLTSVTIPASVSTLGTEVFYECTALSSIDVAEENENFKTVDGIIFSKDGTSLVQYPQNKAGSTYKIPDGVTKIESMAFNYTQNLTNIDFNNVTEIAKQGVYNNAALQTVTIDKPMKLGEMAFGDNNALISVVMNAVPTEMGSNVFSGWSGCESLSSVVLPEGLTSLPSNTFLGSTALKSINFPTTLTSIGSYCFSGSGLSGDLEIPSSITQIGSYAFRNCKGLTSITIEADNPSIGTGAFQSCNNVLWAKGKTNLVSKLTNLSSPNLCPGVEGLSGAPCWFTSDGKKIYEETSVSGETTFYRVFHKKVSVNANGGTDSAGQTTYAFIAPALQEGQTIPLPDSLYQNISGTSTNLIIPLDSSKLSRDGWSFLEWTGDAAGTKKYEPSEYIYNYMPDAIYAQWTMAIGDTGCSVSDLPDRTYTGAEIKPAVVVKNSAGTVLTDGYTVTYSDNINVGEAKAKVTIGNDSVEISFNIVKDNSPTVSLADIETTYGADYSVSPAAKTSAGNDISNAEINVGYYTDAAVIIGLKIIRLKKFQKHGAF